MIRRIGAVAAAATAALLTCAGCGNPTGTHVAPPRPPAPALAPAPGAPIGPGAATSDALVLMSALHWSSWNGILLPTSDSFGPSHTTGNIATGFSHDPDGALIAMMQEQARLALSTDQHWSQVAAATAVTAGTAAAPTRRVTAGLLAHTPPAPIPAYAGFRYLSYAPTAATAALALQEPDGTLATTAVTVDWLAGDWKLQLPIGGAPPPAPLPGLDGYQPWPGLPG